MTDGLRNIAPRSARAAAANHGYAQVLGSIVLAAAMAAAVCAVCYGRGEFGDEGSYCTIAQGLLAHSQIYKDFFNEKPPLQYDITEFVMSMSSPTMLGARLTAALALFLTFSCVLFTAIVSSRNLVLGVAGVVCLPLLAICFKAFNDTAETSLAFVYSAGALLIFSPLETSRKAVILGILSGVALGFRQAAIAPALVLLFSPFTAKFRLAFIIALLFGILLWLIPLWTSGTITEFVRDTIMFHAGNSSIARYFSWFSGSWRVGSIILAPILALIALSRHNLQMRMWLLIWIISICIPFFGRMDIFRLWPALASALVCLAGYSMEGAGRALLGLTGACALAIASLVHDFPASYQAKMRLAGAIEKATAATSRIWVGPFAPSYYCLSRRRPASRFYFVVPWTAKPDVQRQILSDLRRERPSLILDLSTGALNLGDLVPGLSALLTTNYEVADRRAGQILYVLKRDVPIIARDKPAGALDGVLSRHGH